MTINIVYKWDAPIPPYECEIVEVVPEAIPYTLGGLVLKASKYWWDTPDDKKQGRKLLMEQGARLLMPCGTEIMQALHLLYMQQDNIHNGQNYSYDVDPETGAITYSPPIPIVPPNTALYDQPGTRGKLEDLRDMLEAHIAGVPSADYPVTTSTNQKLQQIIDLLNTMDEEDYTEMLELILTALGGAI